MDEMSARVCGCGQPTAGRSRACRGDLVVAAVQELYEAKTVAERVGHHGEAAPVRRFGGRFLLCSGGDGGLGGQVNGDHHEVQVDGRPVAIVAAGLSCCGSGLAACWLGQKVDRGVGAEEFGAALAEAAANCKAEGVAVEADRRLKLRHV